MAHQLTLLLPDDTDFPDPDTALVEPNGLLSVGAALTPAWLLRAYRKGIFPWFDQDDRMPLWWSPDPRAVLLPSELRISRSLGKKIRRKDFRITFDQHFSEVIEACSEPRRGDSGTWITEQMKHAYVELHELGYAHSVEAWQGGLLVGGLYGISLGRMFA